MIQSRIICVRISVLKAKRGFIGVFKYESLCLLYILLTSLVAYIGFIFPVYCEHLFWWEIPLILKDKNRKVLR